jgi:hypothetical protein
MLMEDHLLIELERYVNVDLNLENKKLMLTIIRLLHSIAVHWDLLMKSLLLGRRERFGPFRLLMILQVILETNL